jgi:hypothetical protein
VRADDYEALAREGPVSLRVRDPDILRLRAAESLFFWPLGRASARSGQDQNDLPRGQTGRPEYGEPPGPPEERLTRATSPGPAAPASARPTQVRTWPPSSNESSGRRSARLTTTRPDEQNHGRPCSDGRAPPDVSGRDDRRGRRSPPRPTWPTQIALTGSPSLLSTTARVADVRRPTPPRRPPGLFQVATGSTPTGSSTGSRPPRSPPSASCRADRATDRIYHQRPWPPQRTERRAAGLSGRTGRRRSAFITPDPARSPDGGPGGPHGPRPQGRRPAQRAIDASSPPTGPPAQDSP